MSLNIFIKSYPKDFPFLYRCLESINKYVIGYDSIILVLPEGSNIEFNPPVIPRDTYTHYVKETGDGYLFQQYIKMTADLYCDSDFIMYVDSDCIFYKQINVSHLVKDNKPEILMTNYDKVGDAICWQIPTIEYFNRIHHFEYEYMRRLPLIAHRDTITNVRSLKKDLKDYILSINNRQFSEFNVIFGFAYLYENEKYSFIDTDNCSYIDPVCRQFWSWGNYTDEVKKEIDSLLI